MSRVAILGAGTFAIEVLEAIELEGVHEPVGFVVSQESYVPSETPERLPVFSIERLPWSPSETLIISGIVSTRRQDFVLSIAELGFRFVSVRHPSATISPRATLGCGCFVGAGAIVASNTRLHPHVLVNRGANISHDVEIESFASVGPGVTVAASVTIGPGAYVGVGAVIRDHVTIGEGAIVAAGAVVVKSVSARVLAAGCPARVVREDVSPL